MAVTKTMALTRKMFFETLPRALGVEDYRVDGDVVTLAGDGKSLTITFCEQPTFNLGGFAVPRAQVTLDFTGYDEGEAQAAVNRFDRYFHRGGG